MALTAPKMESQFTLAPEGTHLARCISLIQIGTVVEEYMGEAKEMQKIRFTFELPDETKVFKDGEEPKPLVISQEYTLSMGSKSKLRPIVEGMIGTSLVDDEAFGFDQESLVGKSCLLTIKHKVSKTGKERAEIASTSPLLKNMVERPQVNASKVLTYENWDQEMFDALPNFLKEKMRSSKEYRLKFGVLDSEIPF